MTLHSRTRQYSAHSILALVLVVFSFGLSALVSRTVFERLPHLEDEVAYLFQAKTLAGGELVVDSPEPRRAFWQPFVLDVDGKRFGKYTPGWPLLLAPGILMGEAWVVNAFFAALNVALVYRLAGEIYNRDAGLVAAALTAFSPMALLLNGTLMNHTSALFATTLFLYAYWRLERGKHSVAWGALAGVALGLVVASRPLTGIALALPFAVWSLVRLLSALARHRHAFWPRLRPLLALGIFTLLLASVIPIYNYAATGDPTENLYTLVWSYDQPGFGDCCGRAADRGEGGHDVERGIRHMRFDLSLMAADLFGWQVGPLTDEARWNLLNDADYYPGLGLSWLLLPFGVLVAFRRRTPWALLWLALGFGWLLFIMRYEDGELGADATWSYIWLGVALLWLVLPLFVTRRMRQPIRTTWSWLLIAVALGLILLQLTYWIGSQRYSTRYYYEALTSLAIVSALPVAWLARRAGRTLVYVLFTALLMYSLYNYSVPRIELLRGFNFITRDVIEGVEERREGDRPVLVLISGNNVRWRAMGALMAVSSPRLDSDIVVAWDFGGAREELLEKFAGRQVIEMQAEENQAWFVDEQA